ncbi:MAG: hypothetical protein CVU38_17675 [Chloroflexi bacterium HGW-Chloroflexi-1]|nr:MAG: hypothetical protein CVU38_17675 [Chloroflexi bacterium HGW-Chloroflexi-1]
MIADDDMRAEYDFTGGVRGKHYKALRDGYTVKIQQADGTTVVQHYKIENGAVMLDPDVREYFPDSNTVNNALRSLIALIPKKRKAVTYARTVSQQPSLAVAES